MVCAELLDAAMRRLCQDPGIRLADVAQALGVSERTVTRAVSRDLNCTFRKRLQWHRVETAKSLIVSTEHQLKVIAHLAGFREPSRMSEAFSETSGMSPSDFRLRAHASALLSDSTLTHTVADPCHWQGCQNHKGHGLSVA
jgi:transcriptional regulator GlxA family with amidase domain